MIDVTVVITACNRPQLLKQTLESYFKYSVKDYPIIVIEDSAVVGCNKELELLYPQIKWINNETNLGQAESVDKAYKLVETKYIFHCEEDWEFYKSGFIEDSIPILESNQNILQVWIRAVNDTNGHPIENHIETISGIDFRIVKRNHINQWHGFSFNPSLRRKSDYLKVKPFAIFNDHRKHVSYAEMMIGKKYYQLGYHAVIIDGGGYVKHLGDGFHVEMKRKPSIIVPYRDRQMHLNTFLPNIKMHLHKQGIFNYEILIIEQTDTNLFNRARLLNIGAIHSNSDYLIMHDVDMIPIDVDYRFASVAHLATKVQQFGYKMPYAEYFGGVTIFSKDIFTSINGYSNNFWGWGAEDDEILLRVKARGYEIDRRQCRFNSFDHKRDFSGLTKNNSLLDERKNNRLHFESDGLNSVEYKLIDTIQIDKFTTKIKVELCR